MNDGKLRFQTLMKNSHQLLVMFYLNEHLFHILNHLHEYFGTFFEDAWKSLLLEKIFQLQRIQLKIISHSP